MESLEKIIDSLSPLERKIIPYLNLSIEQIKEKTGLDSTSLLRALKFLENKSLLTLKTEKKEVVDLGTNGIYYKKNHLPERRLLHLLEGKTAIDLQEAMSLSKLTDNEFKVSLGVLKSKSMIELKSGKIFLTASKTELTKKSLEEQLLDTLPIEVSKLEPEQQFALANLKKRKEIVQIEEKSATQIELSSLGKKLAGKEIESNLLEEVTPEIVRNWKRTDKFRKYDVLSPVPRVYAGKKHFVNQAIDYTKRIWLDMGFKEMSGNMTQTSFWNFDALFTAQDHPVRELHDTFYIKDVSGKLPDKKILATVKQSHETGVAGSKGWGYTWNAEETKKVVLRTHTTCLSAQTLASLDVKKDLPAKFFAIGKNFRNETVDWSHGFEFYQTEGIVIGKDLTLRHLLGYLQEFYKKMGFEKVRFSPGYFPYTEPSVEINVFHPEKKVWLELGGAGIFRPEVTVPLLGENIPVLAWGQGFDRIITDYYKIKDLREMYANDIQILREKKVWVK